MEKVCTFAIPIHEKGWQAGASEWVLEKFFERNETRGSVYGRLHRELEVDKQ